MHDVQRPPKAGQERSPGRRTQERAAARDRLRAPVPLTTEGIAAWVAEVRPMVAEIRALVDDATARREHRVQARPALRRALYRSLRRLDARVGALAPVDPPASADPDATPVPS